MHTLNAILKTEKPEAESLRLGLFVEPSEIYFVAYAATESTILFNVWLGRIALVVFSGPV